MTIARNATVAEDWVFNGDSFRPKRSMNQVFSSPDPLLGFRSDATAPAP
jgi:hypothetical protein